MRTIRYSRCVLIPTLLGSVAWCAAPREQATVTLGIETQNALAAIPADFSGLSFEMETLLPGKDGGHYFSASNGALIQTFRSLGIKSLRIGGNTADRPSIPFPGKRDIDNLFSFAKLAGVKVVFTFRLRTGGPQAAAPLAKYMADHYSSSILCFAIGNEPDIYAKTYVAYREELKRYIAAFGGGPKAKFCGPGTTPSKAEWAREFAQDFGGSKQIRFVTQHAYPGDSGRAVTDTAAARSLILSPAWVASYKSFYNSFVPAAEANHLAYRIEETNSFFHGGAKDVSDTFASALWGLDYMQWWARHGAAGINFHTGEQVAAADETTPCFYAVFLRSGRGYAIQPLGYAMKAFDIGGHGRVVPVRVISGSHGLNLTAYGVLSVRDDLYVTLINKENGANARDAAVTLVPGAAYTNAEVIRLEAPGSDIAAKTGLTLRGAKLGVHQNGAYEIRVPAKSAAILKFTTAALSRGL